MACWHMAISERLIIKDVILVSMDDRIGKRRASFARLVERSGTYLSNLLGDFFIFIGAHQSNC